MSKQRLVTLPLDALVSDLLADYDCRTISKELAEILNLVKDNKSNFHVQFPGEHELDINGTLIDSPRLWSLRHWQYTSEKNLRARHASNKAREQWIIMEANVKVIAKHLVKLAMLNPDAAVCIARRLLQNNEFEKIKAIIGPTRRLYTTVKEIP